MSLVIKVRTSLHACSPVADVGQTFGGISPHRLALPSSAVFPLLIDLRGTVVLACPFVYLMRFSGVLACIAGVRAYGSSHRSSPA